MFTGPQIIFAVFFVIVFTGIMIWSYRKDLKLHNIHYKNTASKVLIYGAIVTITFIVFRILIKKL